MFFIYWHLDMCLYIYDVSVYVFNSSMQNMTSDNSKEKKDYLSSSRFWKEEHQNKVKNLNCEFYINK